jgi:hypothetical protein
VARTDSSLDLTTVGKNDGWADETLAVDRHSETRERKREREREREREDAQTN